MKKHLLHAQATITPTISIIIATYNAAKTIQNCLASILIQKNDLIEIIIIDGNSQDGTQALIDLHIDKIDYFVSEKDAGIYDAWNKGIRKTKGEWILFIGADDALEPDAINTIIKFINENDTAEIDYISGKIMYLDQYGQLIKVLGVPWRWDQFRHTMQVAHVASLHKRTLFEEIGLFNTQFRICGDYELLLRKQERLKCLYLDECVARMTTGGASYSMNALWEAHQIRKLHSRLTIPSLAFIYAWQVLLFVRHLVFNIFLTKSKLT